MQMSIPFTMSDVRQQAGLLLAYMQVQQFKNATDAVNTILGRRRQRKAQRRRMLWVRPRLEEARRFQHGHIHCLMPDLRYEDPSNYFNYLRVPPALFGELLDRLRPRIKADFVLLCKQTSSTSRQRSANAVKAHCMHCERRDSTVKAS